MRPVLTAFKENFAFPAAFFGPHSQLLNELYGSDISLYPAHLATLNLAAREINDEANYPRIARTDFFDVVPGKSFCELPSGPSKQHLPVSLPLLDAIVGNPPYIRQEKVSKAEKIRNARLVEEAFPGTELSGRADLHCYFWPHAARFLKEGGYFGFLTSGQWLDVDYGFSLQRWILLNFRMVAVLESSTERWFPDARVKTCITILQRCSDAEKRKQNLVRFVRFEKPLAELIGVTATGGVGKEAEATERLRQRAVDAIRNELEKVTEPTHDDRWRVLIKRQADLWSEGVRAGAVLKNVPVSEMLEDEDESCDGTGEEQSWLETHIQADDYTAGKWGRYLRAPDLYFELMARFYDRFVPLGAIVAIRRGITTGCDKFFMPHDVTTEILEKIPSDKEFKKLLGCSRADVLSGRIRIIRDGARTLHAIEAEYVRPEIHSLMKVHRPEVRAKDLDRVVLLVGKPFSALRGTYIYKYLKHGEAATYTSRKSKAVPVPERSTCDARDPWYDLTNLINPGFALWSKSQQYRHIIPANPDRIIANCNLYDLSSTALNKSEQQVLIAILNSTFIGLFKTFYGRFAGTEGNLKTEIVDVNLIDVPDPRGADKSVVQRLVNALQAMTKRDVGRMVTESLMDCHSYERALELASRPLTLSQELRQLDRRELDDAVFELLGVSSAAERKSLIDRLYTETAAHFRAIRVTEIQKMQDRAKGEKQRFTAAEQAADTWDALDLTDLMPLQDWVRNHVTGTTQEIPIPDERPVHLGTGSMFDQETVYFGKKRQQHIVCSSQGTAELLTRIADLGLSGLLDLPTDHNKATNLLDQVNERHNKACARFQELVESRTSDLDMQDQIFKILQRWFVLGRSRTNASFPVD